MSLHASRKDFIVNSMDALGVTRNGLKDLKNHMARDLFSRSSPGDFLHQYADTVDGLVRKTFRDAQSSVPSLSVCLLAVGGYGRSELAPYSDIDLVLLYDASQREILPPFVEKVLYPLWDLGLDVSCSSRSISECLKLAQSDLHIKTSLMDGRYLDGEYEFFRRWYSLFIKKALHHNVRKFAKELAKDLYGRHQKYQDPSCILEPNLKEGEGGLRDFQIGRWIVRARYKTDRWDSILFPDHSRTLEKSIQFLWVLRNHLHLLSGRRQDELTFELQEKIAPVLGFPPGAEGIEGMMRRYHLSTQRISNFVQDMLERTLFEPSWTRKALFFFHRKKIDSCFTTANGELHLLDPVLFKKDPEALMTLFQHSQTYRAKMDFRIEEAVVEALPFIDDRFRHSERVNRTFLSILRKGAGIGPLLRKMHELGFLSRYLREIADIEGKIHYDLYHVHPVDIHSILAVEELEKLRERLYQQAYPLLSSLIGEIEKPETLLLAALLHDIGKGKEGDHSLIGADMVQSIGVRMGLSQEDRALVRFLVGHHLVMVETAFRRDLHDEQVILRFAHTVKTPTRLKMLTLLTFADIKAVGPEAWTSWKNTLLMDLFLKTSTFFERKAVRDPLLKRDEQVRMLGTSLSPEMVSEYSDHLPSRYLSCYSPDRVSRHIDMACSIEKEHLLVDWEIEGGTRAEVTLCTKDRYGLFSKIAGSMFLNRLNILEAQIHTWGNGIALDTFWVEDPTQEIETRLHGFKNDLGKTLQSPGALEQLLSEKKATHSLKPKVIPAVPGSVSINNRDSDVYTIVEVTGEERMGILYVLTQALTDFGCDIHVARISTLGNRVVDIFYIQDTWGEKIIDQNRMDRLEQVLLCCLAPSWEG